MSPRRKASTRNRSETTAARPSTRTRPSTRSSHATPAAKPSSSNISRTKVYGEKREANRLAAPLKFVMVMFVVVVVSVFAFGLLRGDLTAQRPERPDVGSGTEVFYEKEGTTSTNTGILRGH
ncbi:hypothetical protein [Bacillus sp. SLBN-3]